MKKKSFCLALLCAAMLAGCGQTEEVVEEKTARTVETMTAGTGAISSDFSFSGKVAPSREVSVVPTIAGKVLSFGYEVGDSVGAGAVLFTVDSTDLQNNLRSVQASYDVAELQAQNAKTTLESNQILYDEGIIAKSEYDQIKLAYDTAEANLTSLQVQIDNLQKNIADCSVTSPISGVISARNIEIGSFASQSTPSYTIIDLSRVKVEVGVSEQMVNDIAVGDEVDVLLTAVSPEPLTGTVSTISPAATQAGTYTIKVELDNSRGLLKAGMLAEVKFVKEASDDAIILPRDAVMTKDGETYVYIVENNTAKKTIVATGIESGDQIEITEGLREGMDVVIKGQTYISDGEEVQIADLKTTSSEKTEQDAQTQNTETNGEAKGE